MLTQTVCSACGTINRLGAKHDPLLGRCGKCHENLALGAPIEVDDASLDRMLAHTRGPVLVDVWAPWCGPCRAMAPEFAKAAACLAGKVRLLKLNADMSARVQALGVSGIPSLLLFVDGRIVSRQAGLIRAEELVRWALANADPFQSSAAQGDRT